MTKHEKGFIHRQPETALAGWTGGPAQMVIETAATP